MGSKLWSSGDVAGAGVSLAAGAGVGAVAGDRSSFDAVVGPLASSII